MAVNVVFPYKPRPAFMPFHTAGARFSLLVCHRRAGKTVAVVNHMIARAFRTRKPDAMFAYIAPTYGQAKTIAWTYIKKAIPAQVLAQCKVSESETSIVLPNGSKIRVFGVDKPDNLRGLYFDGIVADEFGEWQGRAYTEVLRPAMSDREGWIVFIGTPKGPSNKFAELRNMALKPGSGWFYMELKASKSGLLPQAELDAMKQEMEPEEYEQELECSFQAAIKGSYYGALYANLERDHKITNVPYDITEKVYCALDIGFADATAIWWWQVVNGEVRFIEYFERTGMDAEECLEILGLKPYEYERIYLPHDAKARTFASKKSVVDTFIEQGAPAELVKKLDLKDGIDSARKTLRTYPVVFDKERCARGLLCLRNYQRKWDNDSKVFSNTPIHDQWSHGADAFRYACLTFNRGTLQESVERGRTKANRAAANDPFAGLNKGHSGQTFQEAWNAYDEQVASSRAYGRARI